MIHSPSSSSNSSDESNKSESPRPGGKDSGGKSTKDQIDQGVIDAKESANEFALQFFRTFINRHGDKYVNLFTSPFVLFTALASILVGAQGPSKDQLEKILRLKGFTDTPQATAAFQRLTGAVFQQNSDYIFVGNFLYYAESLTMTKKYLQTLKYVFALKPKHLEFSNTPISELISTINADMKRATEGVVDEVVDEQEVTRDVKLILVNSILFRGYWETAFNRHTTQQKFHYTTIEGHQNSDLVDMMYNTGMYKYYEVEALKSKAILLPYEGSDLQMLVVLPDNDKTDGVNIFNDFNNGVYKNLMTSIKKSESERKVEVHLPIFALDPNKVSVKGTLEVMGAGGVFKIGADFSGLTESACIHLNRCAHKAFIVVDTKGGTISEKTKALKKRSNEQPVIFKADHPFAFMIIDSTKELIIMIGYFGDPRETLEVVHEEQLTPAEKEALLADIRSNK